MSDLTLAEVFFVLKPMCRKFAEEPSAEKASQIAAFVTRTPNTIIQKFYEVILHPITLHLKANTLKKDDNLILLEIIKAVLLKTKIDNLKVFHEVYFCLRSQICLQENSTKLIEAHEELKEVAIHCMNYLFKNCSISIIALFYTRESAALLSHGIWLCIQLSKEEKSTPLRVAALETVMTLLQVHNEADSQDIVLLTQIADVTMLILPGIVSGLLEVSLGSDVQNHKITVMAIRGWSRIMALVMQDRLVDQNSETLSIPLDNVYSKNKSIINDVKEILKTNKRSPEWYAAVSEKFKTIFIELDNITKHSHYKVRLELVRGVSILLLSCSRNMKICFQILLEVVITLSEDENSEVAAEATKSLNEIQNKCLEDENMKTAIEVLEENLYNLLIKLPRIIRTAGQSLQLVWLNKLNGYLKILGKQRLSVILLSTAHLQKLLLTLIYISEVDCRNISLLEDTIATNFEESTLHSISKSWKQHKFIYDSASIEKLYSIFKILGEYANQKMLVDSLIIFSFEIPKFRKELTLILNMILQAPMDPAVKMSICKQLIDHYTATDYWYLPIKVSDQVSLQQAQGNIVECCLMLEGIGIIANALKEDFHCLLLKTLYLVIERAGSEHSLLRFVGLSTLKAIAESLTFNTIGDLLKANVDYITYYVTLKLRRIERNPGVLDVIEVVTNYTTLDFLCHLKDIVDDLLLQSASSIQKHNAQSFLKVFYAFIMCVQRLILEKQISRNKRHEKTCRKPSDIVINSVLELYRTRRDLQLSDNFDEIHENENLDENLDEIHDNENPDETQENENPDEIHDDENPDEIENAEEPRSSESNENFINSDSNNFDDNNYDDYDDNYEDHYGYMKDHIPYYIEMIRGIMNRCLHYVPSSNFDESTLAMLTLKEGALMLEKWQDVLLPIIHGLWHPLVDRFKNPNPLVVNRAWQLLCCLSRVSKDFIRSRTLNQILPVLSNFLENSSKESFKKDSNSTYQFTQMFKLQREILRGMAGLVHDFKLLERDVWTILEITEPYLDNRQNLELQHHCVNMYKGIADYSTDIVWIKCVDIWNKHVDTVVPENQLNTWYSNTMMSNDHNSSYWQNLNEIFSYVNSIHKTL